MIYSTKAQKLLLPALILITPFLLFLNHNSYCLACAETSIAFGGLILLALMCSAATLLGGWIVSGLIMAGLVTVFIDLQFSPANLADWVENWAAILLFAAMQTFVLCVVLKEKFFTIATAIFSTFFIVTIFQVAFSSRFDDSLFEVRQSAVNGPPRIIHLILDEHIGTEGIPTDVEGGLAARNLITEFYLKNGFQLFGGAFSHYFYTPFSIGNMLNFGPENHPAPLTSGRGPYALLQNKYFQLLSEKKYRIEVLSPGWLNFCSDSKVVIGACIERHWGVLKNFAKLELPSAQKFQVLYSRYLSESTIVTLMVYAVILPLIKDFPPAIALANEWTWALNIERTRTDSLNTLADLKLLWRDIISVPHGNVLFAHLSIPHYPYVALPDCSIRPPNRFFLWKSRGLPNPPPTNTETSRKEHYRQYFQQLECLYFKLEELIDRMRAAGIYENSIIIIHGDHGSRININDPTPENRHAITNRDLVDSFSTLFAMKLPGKPGRYDKSPRPLEELFAGFVFEAGLTPVNILPEKSEPYVYLMTDQAEDPIRIPYIPPN
jgi:hypothetical protein